MAYPWQNINPKDSYNLYLNDRLSDLDIEVLTSFYKPILKQNAYSLFMSLYTMLKFGRESNHQVLLSNILAQVNLGIPEFYQSRIRLEALGLVDTYINQNDENDHLIEINRPLSAQEFLREPLLRTSLYEEIGEQNFLHLKETFELNIPQLDSYKKVTKTFPEVFQINVQSWSDSEDLTKPLKRTKMKTNISESISNIDSFDWKFFISGLNNHFIKTDSITGDIKQEIMTFHLIYNVDELEMQNLLLEAADIDSGEVSFKKLQGVFARVGKNKSAIKPQDKAQPLMDDEKDDDENYVERLRAQGRSQSEISLIKSAKEISPGEYIYSIKQQKGGFVSDQENYAIKDLLNQSHLPTEVINILIQYILVVRKNATFDKKFALTIANDWAQKDVQTAEDALDTVKRLFQQNNEKRNLRATNRNRQARGRVEELPKWASQSAEQELKSPLKKGNESNNSLDNSDFKEKLKKIRKKSEE